MGIIAVGMGAGFVFLASGQPALSAIAFIAAILPPISLDMI